MLKLQVIGNIGKDAVAQTINNNNYAKFSLAVKDGKDQNGNERTIWVDCMKSDKEGKLTPFLTQGKTIAVEGKPTANAYTNKEGKVVSSLSVWVNDLEFVASPKPKDSAAPKEALKTAPAADDPFAEDSIDDLPFA